MEITIQTVVLDIIISWRSLRNCTGNWKAIKHTRKWVELIFIVIMLNGGIRMWRRTSREIKSDVFWYHLTGKVDFCDNFIKYRGLVRNFSKGGLTPRWEFQIFFSKTFSIFGRGSNFFQYKFQSWRVSESPWAKSGALGSHKGNPCL